MEDASENAGRSIINIEGELVALGPLRRDLLPVYQRWINDLGTMRTLGLAPLPMTGEKEQEWYDRQSKTEDDVPFTIYEKETLRAWRSACSCSRSVAISSAVRSSDSLLPWPPSWSVSWPRPGRDSSAPSRM